MNMAQTEKRLFDRLSMRLAIVTVAVLAAFLLRLAILHFFPIEAPFVTFYPAVMIVALLAGFWPGVLATALLSLIADYTIFQPLGSFRMSRTSDALILSLFFGMGIFLSAVAEGLRRNYQRVADFEKQESLRSSEEKLRLSEEQFETLANAIPQLTWMANADGWIFWYNERWYSYTGTTAKDMEGWGWQSVHDPEILQQVMEKWKTSIATGEPFGMVLPLRGADGIFHPFLTRIVPVKDAEGKVVRWFGTNTDISEQRRIEEGLRSSQAKLEGVLGSAMDAIISVNEQQRIVLFNQSAEIAFQCPASEAVGSTLDRFIPISFRESHREHMRRFETEGVTARSMKSPSILRAVRRDGPEFPIEATISQVQADGEKLFTVILRDITERERSEEALRISKARLDMAVEVASLGEWELDLNLGIGSRSLRHAHIFGYPTTDEVWTYAKFLDHVLPQHRADVEKKLDAAWTGGSWDFETQIRRVDGEVRWIWIRGRSSLDQQGQPASAFGTVMDITDRKHAEEVLLRTEKLASVGRMAASISHEINNPLEATVNALYITAHLPELPPAAHEYLQMADEELKRIAHITRQSLGFYRESNGPMATTVTAILESAIDVLKSKINNKQATIERQWDAEVEIVAIAGELRQVFSNLLSNSLDAIEQGGTIKLRVFSFETSGNGRRYVRVTVADNGQGISASSLPRLFEPFYTTKGTIGTGLGLWVTKQIIDKHDGTIQVRSNTQGSQTGTVFSVVLPTDPGQLGQAVKTFQ